MKFKTLPALRKATNLYSSCHLNLLKLILLLVEGAKFAFVKKIFTIIWFLRVNAGTTAIS
jgi:hypothetical protein